MRFHRSFSFCASVFGLGRDDGFSFVETAIRAYAMRHFHFMALRAFDETRYGQFPIGTSLVTARSRAFVFRSRHIGTSSLTNSVVSSVSRRTVREKLSTQTLYVAAWVLSRKRDAPEKEISAFRFRRAPLTFRRTVLEYYRRNRGANGPIPRRIASCTARRRGLFP